MEQMNQVKFLKDVIVNGNLTVTGTYTAESAEQILTKGALTVINADNNALATTLMGTVIRTGNKDDNEKYIDYAIIYDPLNEAVKLGCGEYDSETNMFTFGENEGKPIATRDLSEDDDGYLVMWDAQNHCLVKSSIKDDFNAANIKFDQDLVFTKTFGKYIPSSTTGTVTIPTKTNNMSLLDLLTEAYSEDKNPTITPPSATITFSGTGSFEVGSSVQPKVKFTANHLGSYSYGPDSTGSSWTKLTYSGNGMTEQEEVEITDNTVLTQYYSIGNSVTVEDDTAITVTAALHYSAATATPKTALNADYADGKFGAGNVPGTASITGFRRMFFRTYDSITEISGANIRPSSIDTTNAPKAATTTKTLSIPEGTKQVCIALPAGYTLGTIIPSQGLQVDISSSFTKTENVSIDGAAAGTGANYTVYTLIAADGLSANTYIIKIN